MDSEQKHREIDRQKKDIFSIEGYTRFYRRRKKR